MIKNTILLTIFVYSACIAQQENKAELNAPFYVTTGGELIFSSAGLSINGNEESAIIRFSPVFNFQSIVHFNKGSGFGFMTGLTLHNIGLIYDIPGSNDARIKARTYNLGVPFAIKLGNMNGPFVYAGYEIEMPLNYKEKLFIGKKKEDKFDVWFSNRVNKFQHSVFAGIQLPYGTNIKFKYYLSRFYNKGYSETDEQGERVNPYAEIDVSVFYISLDFSLLKDNHFYYSMKKRKSIDM